MCQRIVILAEREGWRYISQCEHGTVHLLWDGVGIHLPAEPFADLAAHILQSAGRLQRQGGASEHDYCRLQIGHLRVDLPLVELTNLADMIAEALPRLNRPDSWQECTVPQLTFPQRAVTPLLN